jgi:hypothetical protein
MAAGPSGATIEAPDEKGTTMSTEPAGRVRASDAEREEIAKQIREAVSEGRLTLDEGDERLGRLYTSRFRDELRTFVGDLPGAAVQRQQPQTRYDGPPIAFARGFAIHAGSVLVMASVLIGLWALTGSSFFWPAIPLIFFAFSLVRHASFRARRRWYRGYYSYSDRAR